MRLLLAVVFAALFMFIPPALGQEVVVEQIGTSTWHGYTDDGSVKAMPIWSIAVIDNGKLEKSERIAVARNGLDGFVWTPEGQGWKVSNYRNPLEAVLEAGDVSKLVRSTLTVEVPPSLLAGVDPSLIGIVQAVVLYDMGGARVFLKQEHQADGDQANVLAVAIRENLNRQARRP